MKGEGHGIILLSSIIVCISIIKPKFEEFNGQLLLLCKKIVYEYDTLICICII